MKDIRDISYELLHKYNVPGPRYTSYPPAPSWKDSFGMLDYENLISESNKTGAPLSLYFHLPFCEQLCYFCGCTTVITGPNHQLENPYLATIQKEIDWLAQRIDSKRLVTQLHLGGGTPTYLSEGNLASLMKRVRAKFKFAPDAEVGAEIDPRVTTPAHLKTLREAGFNRLSMGVQDFNPKVQKAINREQSYEATKKLVEDARDLGFVSINMDLIYGLPHQTAESFEKTVEQIVYIGPDRLAVYSYAHVPWMKRYQETLAPHLPEEREKFEIFLTALRLFTDAGYEYIGMDHFARPDDELATARKNRTLWRNFQGYTTKAGTDLFGLGMSAIGKINKGFAQNKKELRDYESAINDGNSATARGFILSQDDEIRSTVIQNLLCHAVVVKADIEKKFGIKFDEYFKGSLLALGEAVKDGLVELTAQEIKPTAIGRVLLRNIAMPFDAYLPADSELRRFSRTL